MLLLCTVHAKMQLIQKTWKTSQKFRIRLIFDAAQFLDCNNYKTI